jgi:hypothetical protein
MYMGSVWETVNSIYLEYRCIFVPNLGYTSFLVMYSDVYRCIIITHPLRRVMESHGAHMGRLLFFGFTMSAPAFTHFSLVESRRQDFAYRTRLPSP